MSFIDRFCELFETYSYGNVYYGKLCAHVLLGQILKTNKIYSGPNYVDPRVSIFIVQPSATGKSTPWPLICKTATNAGLVVNDMDDISDAGLIGGIDDVEIIDPETRTKTIAHEKTLGSLADGELLHYDEGQMLIYRPSYAANSLAWLQKALNPIGSEQNSCSRKMKHGEVTIHPTCSLIITSHPIEGLLSSVLNTGFFQRIVLYPRDVPIKDRQALEYMRADHLGERIFTDTDVKELVELLQKVRAEYKDKEIIFDIVNVRPVLKAKIKMLYDLIIPAHERVKEIMATFIPRYINLTTILAYHHCCDRKGEKVEIKDINYGFGLVYVLFQELMTWVEETADFYKLGNKDMTYLKAAHLLFSRMPKNTADGTVGRATFISECSKSWRVSKRTANKYLDKFSGYGKLEEFEDKQGIKHIKIKPP